MNDFEVGAVRIGSPSLFLIAGPCVIESETHARFMADAIQRITADLNTLPSPPDAEETLRLARYRRTLNRETRAEYVVHQVSEGFHLACPASFAPGGAP